MTDEINCAISLHVYPIEVYFSEDEGQCDSNSVYIVRSDRVFYIGFPVSHWLQKYNASRGLYSGTVCPAPCKVQTKIFSCDLFICSAERFSVSEKWNTVTTLVC